MYLRNYISSFELFDLYRLFTANSQGEAGFYRNICALLSIPWVLEHSSQSVYQTASFPASLIVLSQKLAPVYCKYLIYLIMLMDNCLLQCSS